MPSSMALIEADRLSKTYGTLVALQEFSLAVPAGDIVALVGPNGAGKTTALSLLVGLLTPSAGRARIAGFDVLRQPVEAKRILAFLPDEPFLYEQLTVGELVGFIGGMYRLPPQVLRERAHEWLALFGLEEAVRRQVGQLSFGMRSRLALVISLLHEPKALIMDEPFFGLDPQTLRLVKQLLQEQAGRGMAVLLSTHQLPVVEDVAHRVVILDRGRILAVGTLPDLMRRHGGTRLEEIFFRLTSA